MDIGPGDLLEAVESYSGGPYSIVRGRIYVCTDVKAASELHPGCAYHGPSCKTPGGVRLREAPTPWYAFWCLSSFRPVGRPAEAIIRGLRQPETVAA